MPGKWGGARRARPPLDPPMQLESNASYSMPLLVLFFDVVIGFLNFVDKILQFFGITLCALTKENLLKG